MIHFNSLDRLRLGFFIYLQLLSSRFPAVELERKSIAEKALHEQLSAQKLFNNEI